MTKTNNANRNQANKEQNMTAEEYKKNLKTLEPDHFVLLVREYALPYDVGVEDWTPERILEEFDTLEDAHREIKWRWNNYKD